VKAKKRSSPATSYEKVSATLEVPVLRRIRERTSNVSGFLNEAAKRHLHREGLREWADELRAQGVVRDETVYRNLVAWVDETRARRRVAAVRRTRSASSH
jgi:hypothetical protein